MIQGGPKWVFHSFEYLSALPKTHQLSYENGLAQWSESVARELPFAALLTNDFADHWSSQMWDASKCFSFIWITLLLFQHSVGSIFIYSLQQNHCSPRLGHSLAPMTLTQTSSRSMTWNFPSASLLCTNQDIMHTHHLKSCAKFLLYARNFRSMAIWARGLIWTPKYLLGTDPYLVLWPKSSSPTGFSVLTSAENEGFLSFQWSTYAPS